MRSVYNSYCQKAVDKTVVADKYVINLAVIFVIYFSFLVYR